MKQVLLVLAFVLSASAAFGQGRPSTPSAKPIILGHVDEIQSAVLNEKRVLNIYLPEGYKPAESKKYPVIYLLDGGVDEDFIHTVGQVQFASFPWVNRVEPSIVVGIVNVDRQRDFTYPSSVPAEKKRYPNTGHSAKFIAFLEQELQPYIERNYKTNSTRTLIGESLGGLLAAEILLKKPALFDKYIIVAPSLWWDDGSLLKYPTDNLAAAAQKTDVYIGIGKEGIGLGATPHVGEVDANALADRLRASKAKNLTVYFDYLPQEDHATISQQALLNALKMLSAPASK